MTIDWTLTYDVGITLALLASALFNLFQLSNFGKLKGVMRTALREADLYRPGGRDHIRVPYNQAAELIGWESENFPQPDPKDFTAKPGGPHPAQLSASRRRKLGS